LFIGHHNNTLKQKVINMQPETLTFQWLSPLLIGIIAGLVGIIGWMIKGYLNSFKESIDKIAMSLEENIKKVEVFMREINDKHTDVDKRVVRLEEHIKINK